MESGGGSIPVGAIVGGRWRILGPLGEGGFGQVLLAEDASEVGLGQAALKVAHPQTSPRERRDFLAEVKKMAALRHPNLVGYLDSGQLHFGRDGRLRVPGQDPGDHDEVRPYLVTELCQRSLQDHLDAAPGGRLTAGETHRILSDVAAGLQHLHEGGMIHRDLKPGNVLFADGRWKLADFGLMRDLTATGSYHRGDILMGTPRFMAPELFHHLTATAPADVYAIGVLAHMLVTGRAVHQGSGQALIHNISSRPPTIDPAIEARLAGLIRACVDADPTRRPSAARLVTMLADPQLLPPPIEAPPIDPPPPTISVPARPAAPPPPAPAGPAPAGPAPASSAPAPPAPAGPAPAGPAPASSAPAPPAPAGPAPASSAPAPPAPAGPAPASSAPAPPAPAGPAPASSAPAPPDPLPAPPGPAAPPPARFQPAPAGPSPARHQPGPGEGRSDGGRGPAVLLVAGLLLTLIAIAGGGLLLWGLTGSGDGDVQVESADRPAQTGSDSDPGPGDAGPDQSSRDGSSSNSPASESVDDPADESVDGLAHFASPPCANGSGGLTTLTNGHDQALDYRFTIDHLDGDGVRIEEAYEEVLALEPGRTALVSLQSSEDDAATCAIGRAEASPTSTERLDHRDQVEIVSCELDEFFGNWYDITYTVANPTGAPAMVSTWFGIVDADGVRIDESFSDLVFGVDPGERVRNETSAVFWNMDHTDREPVECVVTSVEIEPDPSG